MPRKRLDDITAEIIQLASTGPGSSRLPPVRELAARLKTSHVTVLRAIHRLTRRGLLLTRPGAGTFISPPSRDRDAAGTTVPTPRREPRGTRAQRVLDSFSADLGSGRYPPGKPLPMAKELCALYGVSRATLRNVLMSLRTTGRVQEHGRWWWVRPFGAPGAANTVACIVNVDPDYGGPRQLHNRELDLLRALESAAQRAGMQLRLYMARLRGQRFENEAGREIGEAVLADRSHLYGIVHLTPGFDIDRWGMAVVRTLAQAGLPMAVIDENGFFTPDRLKGLSRNVRVFAQAVSRRSGLLVGRYLSALGHRRVAYFDDGWGTAWSENRMAGLRQAFAEVGAPAAVQEAAFGCGVDRAPMPDTLTGILDAGLTSLSRRDLARVLNTLNGQVDSLLSEYGMERALAPFMATVLNEADVTCWVCANDPVGSVARRFLATHGVQVPKQISMIAFDDTVQAMDGRFSSYSFNPEGLAAACIGHITNHPLWRRTSTRQSVVEIDGQVHDRGTVRRLSAE